MTSNSIYSGVSIQMSSSFPFKNVQKKKGLVAVDKAAMDQLPRIRDAMLKVQEMDPPTYN
jgi:hypothetical protein